jgi:RHS repeat-associated protein
MFRLIHKFLTILVLLSITGSALPPASVFAADTTTVVNTPQNPTLPVAPLLALPALEDLGSSTSLPPTDVSEFRSLYGSRHTANGNLPVPSQEPHIILDADETYSLSASNHAWNPPQFEGTVVITRSVNYNHGVIVDVTISNDGNATAFVDVREAGTSTWYSAGVLSGKNVSVLDKHVLFRTLPFTPVAVEIRLRCAAYSWNLTAKCTFSNLRFSGGHPGWLFPVSDTTPTTKTYVEMKSDSFKGIEPLNGPFLGIEVFEKGPFRITSSLIDLPTGTAPITMSLQWAREPTVVSSTSAPSADIYFQSVSSTKAVKLVLNGPNSSVPWTRFTSGALPAGETGYLLVYYANGTVPHVMGFDDITIYQGGKPVAFPMDQLVGKCVCDEGGNVQAIVGDPVNSYSGSFYLQTPADVALIGTGAPLALTRTYVSMFADPSKYPTTALGSGWRHDFASVLTLPSQVGGEPYTFIYEAPSGNRLRFYGKDNTGVSDEVLSPAPGIRASLVRKSGIYTLTSRDQSVEIFDSSGKLQERRTPQGHTQQFTYYTGTGQVWDGQLSQVTDVTSGRSLSFTYTSVGGSARLQSVTQAPGQSVSFTYTSYGDLETVTDLRGGVTTYSYDGSTHHLTSIQNPLLITEITNTYDSNSPRRVIYQVDHTGLSTTYSYNTTASQGRDTTITFQKPGEPAQVQIDHYRHDGTLEYQELNGKLLNYLTFDSSLTPNTIVNGNGEVTLYETTASGQPLKQTDALGNTATATYDSVNRLRSVTSSQGITTQYEYDSYHNLIRQTSGITTTNPISATNLFTYTLNKQLAEQSGPDGVRTRYEYNSSGQVISTTIAYGTPLAQTTTYDYDILGRPISTTVGYGTSLARTSITEYNPDNSVKQTITNYKGSGIFNPAYPDQNITTTYGYDLLGRTVAITDTLGHVSLTHYNEQGFVDWTMQNAVDVQYDAFGQPIYEAFSAAQPDRNVSTLYQYDGLGRTSLVTETGLLTGSFDPVLLQFSSTDTRTTRYQYDELSRPMTVTLNYRPSLPATADTNIELYTRYDGAGNVITQTDTLGRWTVIEYDALNRPVKTINTYEDGNPLTGSADTDIVTVLEYDSQGRVVRSIDNYVDGIFTISEPITDTITFYEYDHLGRPITTTLNLDPLTVGTRTDTNITSRSVYDAQTFNLIGNQNTLGQWTAYQYDQLGRVTASIQNCAHSQAPFECGLQITDANIMTQTHYDALGRTSIITDSLGIASYRAYDAVGRVVEQVANWKPGVTPNADTNVTTSTSYDALGRAVSYTDALNNTAYTGYNGLGYTSIVTDTMGRVTRLGYDGRGTLRWQLEPNGVVSVNEVDGLGRTIKAIQNYQDGTVSAFESTDQDVITQQVYDRAGRVIRMIDALDRVTAYTYDLQDRLVLVTENYAEGTCTWAPCNVQTQYQYDRVGNRTAIIDANGNTRTFEYDAAYRQVAKDDPVHPETEWAYNARGQVETQFDPRGSAYDLSYRYDLVGRLRTVSPSDPDQANLLPISFSYDARGQRTKLIDGTGITTFEYDALGRPTQIKAPITGAVSYTYDARGQRTQTIYPHQAETISYEYWPDGRLRSVKNPTELAGYSYTPDGRLSTVSRANDVETNYTYDDLGRITAIEHVNDNGLIGSFEYTLDRLGLRTSLTETMNLTDTVSAPPPSPTLPVPTLACTNPAHDTLNMQSIPGYVDDASTLMRYSGTWEPLTAVAHTDNGTMTRTSAADSSVALTFSGNRIAYVYSMGPDRGTVLICIDGVPVLDDPSDTYTLNAYAPQYMRGVVRTFEVTPGTHTIEIIALEDSKYIDIDGLSVDAGYRTEGTYDDRDSLIYYFDAGEWVDVEDTLYTGTISNTLRYSDEPYAFLRFTFYGTQVQLRYRSGPQRSEAVISIDGSYPERLDQRFPHYQSGQAWMSPALELGYHTITMMVSPSALEDERVSIDGFTILNNPPTAPPTALPTLPLTTERTITYTYDGLLRLISAEASDGDDYTYTYDLVGNRTGVWVNGIRTETKTFDAANQVVGWTYDAAGNLLYDGSLSYGYDALNRLVQQGTSVNRYNGDGALVQTDRVAYTQDLASSLSKVLQINDGTHHTNYIYGHERLLSDAAGGEWYATDALGSLRFTLDGDGLATSGTTYDPFGQRERGTIATFGFTGELQDANSDNVYLRARWYNPSHGAFMAQDPFGGFDTLPYSMHPYQYAYSNPGLFTDPSGRCIDPVSGTTCWAVGSAIAEAVGAGLTAIGGASVAVAGAAGAATAGVGYGVYYFGFAENAEENRADLARGWDYVTSGGAGYVWLDEAPQTTSAPHGKPDNFELPPFPLGEPATIQHTGHPAPYCPPEPLIFVQGSPLSEQLPPFALEGEQGPVVLSVKPNVPAGAPGKYQEIVNNLKTKSKILSPSQAKVPNENLSPALQESKGFTNFDVKADIKYLWVLTADGSLIIAPENTVNGQIKHVQLTNYGDALGAGEVQFDNQGNAFNVNVESGRYIQYNFNNPVIKKRITRQDALYIQKQAEELFKTIGH